MRKALMYLMSLAVGLALVQLAGCSKSTPSEKPGQPGGSAKSDPLGAVGKKLVGVWKGKPTPQDEKKKVGPEAEMPVTIEFKDGGAMSMNMAIITLNGTWQVLSAEGSNVGVKLVMEMPDLSIGMEKGKEKAEAKGNKETKDFSIVFLSDDRLTMAPKEDPKDLVTLDRQKK